MITRRALPLLAVPAVAVAQPRPLRVIVAFAPGGQSDTVMRLLQPRMAEALGQPVVVENRAGAGGAIAAGVVAGSPPDGNTLLFDSFGFVVQSLVQRGLPFDYETAFAAVGQATELPYVLVTRMDFPGRDLAGFIAQARARPGVTFGTPGIGSTGHLAGVLLGHRAGVRLEHVPYRGGADAARDVAAGNLDCAISTANTLRPLVQDGRARGIALTSAVRRGSMADLPTIAESGFPGFDLTSWNGLFAPAATPAPVIGRLSDAMRIATQDPFVRERLGAGGNEAVSEPAAAFAARVASDRRVVRQLVAETGLRLE